MSFRATAQRQRRSHHRPERRITTTNAGRKKDIIDKNKTFPISDQEHPHPLNGASKLVPKIPSSTLINNPPTSADWEAIRPRFTQLFKIECKHVWDIRDILANEGFYASYVEHATDWNIGFWIPPESTTQPSSDDFASSQAPSVPEGSEVYKSIQVETRKEASSPPLPRQSTATELYNDPYDLLANRVGAFMASKLRASSSVPGAWDMLARAPKADKLLDNTIQAKPYPHILHMWSEEENNAILRWKQMDRKIGIQVQNTPPEVDSYAWLQSSEKAPVPVAVAMESRNILKKSDATIQGDSGLPFTDSGYASGPMARDSMGGGCASAILDDGAHSFDQSMLPEDGTRTWYTGSSVDDRITARHYIQELAEDIFAKLRLKESKSGWETIRSKASALFKAFALKIGHFSNSVTHRNAMRFIHKHSKEVMDEIERLCSDDDESAETERDNSANMSLSEKMALWSKNEGEPNLKAGHDRLHDAQRDPEVELDQISDEIEGLESDDANSTELSLYRSLIFDSPAYEWLLSSLRNEMLLSSGNAEAVDGNESLTIRIAKNLPTGVVSKRQPPIVYDIRYETAWDVAQFISSSVLKDAIDVALASNITIVSNSDHFQAIPCLDYLRQTWPSSGESIMRLLQNVVVGERGVRFSDTLHDNTVLTLWAEDSRLRLTACGTAFSVAECGEQFAWLCGAWICAVLQRWSCHWGGYCTPAITKLSVDHQSVEAAPDFPKKTGVCHINFRFSPEDDSTTAAANRNWRSLFVNPVALRVFAIPRRHSSLTGVEVTLDTMRDVTGMGVIKKLGSGVCIGGSRALLALCQRVQDIFVWHIGDYAEESYGFSQGHLWTIPEGYSWALVTAGLERSRHIIADLPASQNIFHGNENFQMGNRKTRFVPAAAAMDDGNPSSWLATWKHDEPTSSHHRQDDSQQRKSREEPQATAIEVTRYAQDDNECSSHIAKYSSHGSGCDIESAASAHGDTLSNSIALSNRDSTDLDMLSISDSSVQLDLFGLGPIASEFLIRVFHLLLDEWEAVQCGPQSSGSNGQSSSATASQPQPSLPSTSTNSHQPNRKRCRSPNRPDDRSDQGDIPNPLPKKVRPDQSVRKLFACPFWKMNPERYQDCFSKRLARIRDVKQHLSRQHTPEFYCERCFQVFTNKQIHATHVMAAEPCPARPSGKLKGVSNEQRKALSKKSPRWQTAPQQWYTVWNILFGADVRQPDSPYMDFERLRDFDAFVDLCQQRVSAMLAEQLTARVLESMVGIPACERLPALRGIVETGFRSALESFSASSAESAVSGETHTADSAAIRPPWMASSEPALESTISLVDNPPRAGHPPLPTEDGNQVALALPTRQNDPMDSSRVPYQPQLIRGPGLDNIEDLFPGFVEARGDIWMEHVAPDDLTELDGTSGWYVDGDNFDSTFDLGS